MREYFTLLPYINRGGQREVICITPELDLIAKGLRRRKFCTDETGKTNTARHGGVSFAPKIDTGLTAVCWLMDADDETNDQMNAELAEGGRILLKGDTLEELLSSCQSRLVQLLADAPPIVRNAFASGTPEAFLRPRVVLISDPGDVPGFAALKTWVLSVIDSDPRSTVFPPALHPGDGEDFQQRYAAILGAVDDLATREIAHFYRVAVVIVEALMLRRAIEALA